MTQDLKLYRLITESDLVDECGWITNGIFSVWVSYDKLKEFLDKLKEICGSYILEYGYTDCILLEDSVYIELSSLIAEEVILEDIFPIKEFEH